MLPFVRSPMVAYPICAVPSSKTTKIVYSLPWIAFSIVTARILEEAPWFLFVISIIWLLELLK